MSTAKPTDFGAPRRKAADFRDPAVLRMLLRRAGLWRWFYSNRIHLVRLREVRTIATRLGHLQVREATAADIPDLNRIHRRPGHYEPKFRAGDVCLVAYARGEPAAMAWFALDPIYRSGENRYSLALGEAGCWSYWVDVRPEYRLRGALVKLWADGLRLLHARGLRDVYSGIEDTNQISLKSHLRLGFSEFGVLSYVRFAGMQRFRLEYPDGRVQRGWGRWQGHPDPGA